MERDIADVLAYGAGLLRQIEAAGLSDQLDTRLFRAALARHGAADADVACCPGCGGSWTHGTHVACLVGLHERM